MTTGRGMAERDVELVGDAGYAELLSEIRRELQRSRIKTARAVNAEMIGLYWRIGRMILDRQGAEGWGAKVIEQLAADLKEEAPRGFSRSNLHHMRAFAEARPDFNSGRAAIVQQAVGQIPWSHNVLLLTKLKTPKDRLWYAERAASEGWSRHVLTHHIATELKERQGTGKSNFKVTLAPADSDLAQEMLTDPLDLSFLPGEAVKSERDLELALLEDIETFMLSVSRGQLTFAGRQKELQIGGESFFLDLLFFHVGLLRWVVVELKIGKFEPAFAGQLNFYSTLWTASCGKWATARRSESCSVPSAMSRSSSIH
jgi:predicted nuclease of restriction endonuclease-like (RecB) superfamily